MLLHNVEVISVRLRTNLTDVTIVVRVEEDDGHGAGPGPGDLHSVISLQEP